MGKIMACEERLCYLRLGRARVRLHGVVLFWKKCIRALYLFVTDKEQSSLEIIIPPKESQGSLPSDVAKLGPTVDLEAVT